MPGEIETSVSFLDGASTIGGLTLEVFANAKSQAGNTIASMLYDQTRVSVGTLQTDINSASTTIQLDSAATGLAGKHIAIGREVIYLGTHAERTVYRAREGPMGDEGESHSASDFAEVFDAIKGPVLRYRKVTLFRVDLDSASSYSDLEQLGVFLIYTITAPTPESSELSVTASPACLTGAPSSTTSGGAPAALRRTRVMAGSQVLQDVTVTELSAPQDKLGSYTFDGYILD